LPPAYDRGVRTEIHRGPLDDLLPDWEELFAADDDATPFSAPGWSRAWWEVWGDSAEPWVVLAHNGSGLCGLAPLAVTRHGPIRVLRPLSGDLGDYWDVLAPPAERATVCAAIAREIARRRDEWDTLILHGVRPASPVRDAVEAAGLRVRSLFSAVSPALELPNSLEAYLGSLPPRRRTSFRRHLRRLDEGEVVLREVQDQAGLESVIGQWHELRSRQWHAFGKELDSLQRSKTFRDFMFEAARRLVPAGLLLVWEFRYEGALAGVYMNLVDHDTFHWYQGGFDPDLARLGIGKITVAQGIRSSIEAGRRRFDFGGGTEPYKYWFGAVDLPVSALVAGSSSPRSRAGLLAVRAVRGLRERREGTGRR
jgi:CelD/BcsL family acetyltransferase involved in cellulose biosynthesis